MVDVANVMGARPDGWWRDRAGAAVRLGREVAALATADQATRWILVVEGRARDAAAELAAEAGIEVVSAPASGDDTIVAVVAQAVARGESCLVVTADRELRRRCEEHGASPVGPGWLLGRLLPGNIDVTSPRHLFTINRNLGRMYLILTLSALLILAVAYLAVYYTRSVQRARAARKQQQVAARLHAVVARAEQERAAAQASAALTTVLPCISTGDRAPRHVA